VEFVHRGHVNLPPHLEVPSSTSFRTPRFSCFQILLPISHSKLQEFLRKRRNLLVDSRHSHCSRSCCSCTQTTRSLEAKMRYLNLPEVNRCHVLCRVRCPQLLKNRKRASSWSVEDIVSVECENAMRPTLKLRLCTNQVTDPFTFDDGGMGPRTV
jgi:hypothetical protein